MSLNLVKQQPLISVVIPSFNHDKWIGKAIDSVLNQSYKNFELLIIDNHSTDSTDTVINEYQDPRIKTIKVTNNGSIAFSRNKAIQISSGEWVAFLDSDDWWENNKLEECAKFFSEDTDFMYHNLVISSEATRNRKFRVIRSRQLKKPVFLDLLINGNTIATSSVVMRRELLITVKGMNEKPNLIGIEDFNTWLRIAKVTDKFKLIPKNLGYYRLHDMNVSQASKNLTANEATAEFINELSSKQLKQMKVNSCYSTARIKFLNGNHGDLRRDLHFIIKFGRICLKIRAVYMLLVELIKYSHS